MRCARASVRVHTRMCASARRRASSLCLRVALGAVLVHNRAREAHPQCQLAAVDQEVPGAAPYSISYIYVVFYYVCATGRRGSLSTHPRPAHLRTTSVPGLTGPTPATSVSGPPRATAYETMGRSIFTSYGVRNPSEPIAKDTTGGQLRHRAGSGWSGRGGRLRGWDSPLRKQL